jgi:hypothetical protein
LASDSEGENLKRYATAQSAPSNVATSCATTTKENRAARLLGNFFFPLKANFFQENF